MQGKIRKITIGVMMLAAGTLAVAPLVDAQNPADDQYGGTTTTVTQPGTTVIVTSPPVTVATTPTTPTQRRVRCRPGRVRIQYTIPGRTAKVGKCVSRRYSSRGRTFAGSHPFSVVGTSFLVAARALQDAASK